MRKFHLFLMILFFLAAFFFHLFGLMHIVPLSVTSPLLFLAILLLVLYVNERNRFKGF